jgi:hypothetical protein
MKMIARKTTINELTQALESINKHYDGNIQFKEITPKGTTIQFTLRVKNSHGKGARLGFKFGDRPQRHLINACWHAHGELFDELFKINPEATIRTGQMLITNEYGNWQDRNIGSQVYPMYFSEACECDKWDND